MDDVFRALADPGRRRLLDSLNARNGQTLGELCGQLDMARQSVSKHLAVLEAAQLVVTSRRGREKLHFLNAAPINAVADRWISRYDRARAQALADLTTALEIPVTSTDFVYVSYVATTPDKLFKALVEPEFTRRYWGVALESEWTVGAPLTWIEGDTRIDHPDQRVIAYEPPRRLAYTWHTFTPEWAASTGMGEEFRAQAADEPRSTVTFDIEDADGIVKLTVTHSGFPADSIVRDTCSQGWPHLLSSLKTLLETGRVLAPA
ncbi:ArsR/SmtB family transcription factor [Pseudonocardia sp. CA-107938]|uniref:ArsR/SmtB family transcription factor n=1 Tax=Pseudonocardia sp. CA-107938 TaxID=3240021 RepID=UPI003D90591E